MMKQLFKTLLNLAVFVLFLGATNACVSAGSSADSTITAPLTTEQGSIYENNNRDHILSLRSEEMILPCASTLSSVGTPRRISYTSYFSFQPEGKSFLHQASKDFKDNYSRLLEEQASFLLFSDRSLQYVFKLRRILI